MLREIVEGKEAIFKEGDKVRYKSGDDDRIFTVDKIYKDAGWRYDFKIGTSRYGHRAFEKDLEKAK